MLKRSILPVTAALVTAAAVAGIAMATDGSDESPRPQASVVAPTGTPDLSGPELAAAVSAAESVSARETRLPSHFFELVEDQQGATTDRAWPLRIPGDDRTAWLFAGNGRVAILLPRTVVDPERGKQPDGASIFGISVRDFRTQPIVVSQAAGGQAPRTVVIVPPGGTPPRIVARNTDRELRPMPHIGSTYADQITVDEQLIVDGQRIGATEVD